tara:strand:+ start:2169 stop:2756 length:588 start_codon:yes stop_codon:yes gene_type:complete
MSSYKVFLIGLGSLIICLTTLGAMQPYIKAALNNKKPELILVLGGDISREKEGIRLSKELDIPLLISGGSNREYAEWLIQKEGLNLNNVKLDYRAKDTLTNFTSILDDLSNNRISHILMITSEEHFSRASLIGKIVTGSRGIKLTSLSLDCFIECEKESYRKKLLDSIRALTWVSIGKDPKLIYKKFLNSSQFLY